jgi:ribosomal protein S18 acetylase RimI-like enzyme
VIEIIPYEDRYAADFKRLNLEWLHGFNLFEEADLKHLDHARDGIIDKGGEIWIAVDRTGGDEAVGTIALVPHGPGVVELIKLAVTKRVQGKGVGRRLCEKVIARARATGARKIELVSSHKLESALKLYESLGFKYGPLPEDPGYETTDIFMELAL